MQPVIITLIVHIVLCIILLVYKIIREIALRIENIIPIVLIPIFGPIAGLMIEWLHFSGKHGEKLPTFENRKTSHLSTAHGTYHPRKNPAHIVGQHPKILAPPRVQR